MIERINSRIIFYLFFTISFLTINTEIRCEESLGESLYDNHCSDCHSVSLRGSAHGSSLIGKEFLVKWEKIKCDNPLDNDYLNGKVDDFILWYNEKRNSKVRK